MPLSVRRVARAVLATAASPLTLVVGVQAVRAQGTSGAAVDGQILGRAASDSAVAAPLPGATVTLRNTANGARTTLVTRGDGRFHVENVEPGGPYTIEARAIGFAPAEESGVVLHLGQRYAAQLTLRAAAPVRLEPVRVAGGGEAIDPVDDRSRTGSTYTVTDSAIRRLPVLSRDFVELIQQVPGVIGTSVDGLNNRYNNFLVDGAVNNDFFGLSRGTGTPSGQEGIRSLPLDAIDQFQLRMAPYDVRQGNFVASEIDAITKSGTNDMHGSGFMYYRTQSLVGIDTAGKPAGDFRTYDYGLSAGGPIVPDKLHFFVATELERRVTPYGSPVVGPGTPIPVDSAARFASILKGYGISPGTYGPYNVYGNDNNVFVKLTAPTGDRGNVELSFNYADGFTADTLAPGRSVSGDYRLTSAGFAQVGITRATRLRWTSVLGANISNEAIADYLQDDEPRTPASDAPGIFVSGVGAAGTRLIGGGDPASQTFYLRQRTEELTDNLTIALGAHTLTAGASAQLHQFTFTSLATGLGQWSFSSLTNLAAGTASSFTRTLVLVPGGASAAFPVDQGGAYVQDAWSLPHAVTLTGGMRADLTAFPDSPVENAALAKSVLGINTSTFIATQVQFSPRLGANWQVNDATALRGGVGLFQGDMPFNWAGYAYALTGVSQATLTCKGAATPAFTPDPAAQPTACAGGTGVTPGPAQITVFAHDFKLPQELKGSVGIDRKLFWGITGSVDVLYQYAVEQVTIHDANLAGPVGTLPGEGGRVLYGTIAPTSAAGTFPTTTPAVVSSAFGPVLVNGNSSGDRSLTITSRAAKRFTRWLEFNAAYTYENAREYMSLRDAQTVSNYAYTPVDGSLADRALATSTYDIPSSITVSATANGPLGTEFSLSYLGRSGYPYTYIVNGDANADGVGNDVGFYPKQQNDPVYVPKNASDISLVRDSAGSLVPARASAYDSLFNFINGTACLRANAGHLLPRNGCRNPWQNLLNARIGEQLRTLHGQSIEITLDIFNVLNLINRSWGLVRETGTLAGSGTENVPFLTLRGTDPALGRNLYQLSLPAQNVINAAQSYWQMQLGLRYNY